MKEERCLIFTELLSSSGLGHFSRCSVLYDYILDVNMSPLFVLNTDGAGSAALANYNVQVCHWLLEDELKNILNTFHSPLTVVDSYLATEKAYQTIINEYDYVVCLDDTNRLNYPKGAVILNPGIIGDKLPYSRSNNQVFAGIDYVLLRKPFREKVPNREVPDTVSQIILTLGGDDALNLTPLLMKEIRKAYAYATIFVVIGPSFKHSKEIQSASDENTKCILSPNAEEMRDLMLSADLAVSAGGQTLYELAHLGVAMVVIKTADNQKYNIEGFQELGIIESACDPKSEDFILSFRECLLKVSSKQERLNKAKIGIEKVKGQGGKKILSVFLAKQKNITFRKAGLQDVDLYFEWINEPETRKFSYNQGLVSYESHVNWFHNKLSDDNCTMLLFFKDDIPIGQVRFEKKEAEKKAIISVSIPMRHQGQGYGSTIIPIALEEYFKSTDADSVYAYIFKKNEKSMEVFYKSGFSFDKDDVINDIPSSVLIKKR